MARHLESQGLRPQPACDPTPMGPLADSDEALPDPPCRIAGAAPHEGPRHAPWVPAPEPLASKLVFSLSQLTRPAELTHGHQSRESKRAWLTVTGLETVVRTETPSDKVLLLADVPACFSKQHCGVSWALSRGRQPVGPVFRTAAAAKSVTDHVLLPWVDVPGGLSHGGCDGRACLESRYSVQATLKASVHVSKAREKRHLCAVVLPDAQVALSHGYQPQAVGADSWSVVDGLTQDLCTLPGERVLVLSTIHYTPLWTDEFSRGRFTITRDEAPLDPESFGLQSVRSVCAGGALQRDRSLFMALVDDPPPGPHVYVVRGVVTPGEKEPCSVCNLEGLALSEPDDGDSEQGGGPARGQGPASRQLALIRLPFASVRGPCRCVGSTLVEEDTWTQVQGLEVSATTQGARDKVLVVSHSNFDPADTSYEVYFTIFRAGGGEGVLTNLGNDSVGLWSVTSQSPFSSEYPHLMHLDTPGAGQHTYSIWARTRRCEHHRDPSPAEVGPDGQIAVVLLGAGSTPKTLSSRR